MNHSITRENTTRPREIKPLLQPAHKVAPLLLYFAYTFPKRRQPHQWYWFSLLPRAFGLVSELYSFYYVVLRAIVGPRLRHPPRRLLQQQQQSFLLLVEVYLYYLAAKRILVGYAVSPPPALGFEKPHPIMNAVVASIAAQEKDKSRQGIV